VSKETAPDVRSERSRAALCDALRALIRESAEEITVSGLCKRAGVSRPTFYQHFRTPDDVLVAALEERLNSFDPTPVGSDASVLVATFLRALEGDRLTYQRAIVSSWQFGRARHSVETWLADRLKMRAERNGAAGPQLDARARFAAGGVVALVEHWLTAGPQSADELAGTLWELLRRLLPEA
jgi:AcrR family transcriptional regulator